MLCNAVRIYAYTMLVKCRGNQNFERHHNINLQCNKFKDESAKMSGNTEGNESL